MRPVSSILALSLTFAASSALAGPNVGFRGVASPWFAARPSAPVVGPFGRNTPTIQERARQGSNYPLGTPAWRGPQGNFVDGRDLPAFGTTGGSGFGRGCGPSQGAGGCRGGGYGGYGYSGLGYGYDLGYGQSATSVHQVAPTMPSTGVSGIRTAPVLPPTIYVLDGSANEARREPGRRTEARAAGPLIIHLP